MNPRVTFMCKTLKIYVGQQASVLPTELPISEANNTGNVRITSH